MMQGMVNLLLNDHILNKLSDPEVQTAILLKNLSLQVKVKQMSEMLRCTEIKDGKKATTLKLNSIHY